LKTAQLIEMERLLALKFRSKQQVFVKIVAEEARLRGRIAKLDAQAREAETEGAEHLRAIGADVIWKSWVERAKRSLNLELAQVLAQKERLKATVRREYGKVLVSRSLIDTRQSEEARQAHQRQLETAIEGHLLTAARNRALD
jgi:hypothetical protein